jgi:phage repressor protein C with HTH and peptisase S24 domain
MNAKEILETILKDEGITYNELSKKMGLKRAQALYDIRDGKIKHISHEAAEKIISAYPQYNKSWLLTGDGNVINNEPASEESAARNIEYTNNFKLVPLINLDVVGGMHSQNEVINQAEFILGTIAFNDALEGDRCIQVSGHSMEPVCPPGSIVLIRPVEFWREYFGFGNLFVILLKDGRRILKKVVKSQETPKDNVTCVSLNKEYPEEDLPKDFIQGVWKVIKILVDRGW